MEGGEELTSFGMLFLIQCFANECVVLLIGVYGVSTTGVVLVKGKYCLKGR